MKSINNKTIFLALSALLFLVGCKKESPNIFDMFDVKLTFHESVPYAIGDDAIAEINGTDSVLVDYTIESPTKDMYLVCLYKTGGTSPIQKIPLPDGKRKAYSGTFKFYAKDLGAGTTSYRIWAVDKDGVYLGDGYKTITINVLSDIRYLSLRKVFMPDSVGKVNESFLSIDEGKTYSYTTGKANSAKIDFGIYRDTVLNALGVQIGWKSYLYSTAAAPNPFVPYDISTWTKRATLFSAPVAGTAATFRSMFSTAAKIIEEAKKKTINLTKITTGLTSNQFIYFLTPEGKYGVIMIQSFNFDYMGRPYITMSYKMPM